MEHGQTFLLTVNVSNREREKVIKVAVPFLFPLLIAIDCGPPPAGGNLLVEYTQTNYKSIALYSCKTCHRLNSENNSLVRQCDDSGHWSGPLPVCQSKYCLYFV